LVNISIAILSLLRQNDNALSSLCNLHNFTPFFLFSLALLTTFLHVVHNLFIFLRYNKFKLKNGYVMFFITHIDKFFHNSPGAEMYPGTPHFSGHNHYCENKKGK